MICNKCNNPGTFNEPLCDCYTLFKLGQKVYFHKVICEISTIISIGIDKPSFYGLKVPSGFILGGPVSDEELSKYFVS